MTTNQFYQQRIEDVKKRWEELSAIRPKLTRSKIEKTICDEYTANGDKLATSTIRRIVFDQSYLSKYRNKQSA
jgi:hypothetical protein